MTTVTVNDFTLVAAAPVPRSGFALLGGWLYEDGKILGQVREVIDESPEFLTRISTGNPKEIGPPAGPWSFVLFDR